MTPEQYAEFDKYVPMMEHVWNTVPDTNTNVTPFQAEHGMKCRTIAESILQEPPATGLSASADDLKSIDVSVNAFMEHIHNVKAIEATQTAIRLNADGTSKVEYAINDEVGFFLPPSDETVKAMGKKKMKNNKMKQNNDNTERDNNNTKNNPKKKIETLLIKPFIPIKP